MPAMPRTTSRSRSRQEGKFFVADRACPSEGAAVSYAQGLASAWARVHPDEERSFYVRDALNNGLYRVDVGNGIVWTSAVGEEV